MTETEQLTDDLANGVLAVLVRDMEYSLSLPPTYGHAPMRHHFLWENCRQHYGTEFESRVAWQERQHELENIRVKTNPQLTRAASGPD